MNHGQANEDFLNAIDKKTRDEILDAVAKHYGITPEAALAELVDAEAEHLLDYLTGAIRSATHVLMKRHLFQLAN